MACIYLPNLKVVSWITDQRLTWQISDRFPRNKCQPKIRRFSAVTIFFFPLSALIQTRRRLIAEKGRICLLVHWYFLIQSISNPTLRWTNSKQISFVWVFPFISQKKNKKQNWCRRWRRPIPNVRSGKLSRWIWSPFPWKLKCKEKEMLCKGKVIEIRDRVIQS